MLRSLLASLALQIGGDTVPYGPVAVQPRAADRIAPHVDYPRESRQLKTIPFELRETHRGGCMTRGAHGAEVRTPRGSRAVVLTWTSEVARVPREEVLDVAGLGWVPYGASLCERHEEPGGFFVEPLLEERIGTAFEPTAVLAVDATRVLVAGGLDAERIVLEVWTFAWPDPVPETTPAAGCGCALVEPVLPERVAVETLLDEPHGLRGWIEGLVALERDGGPPTHALVAFGDPAEIHELDLGTGASSRLVGGLLFGRLGRIPILEDARVLHMRVTGFASAPGHAYVAGYASYLLAFDPGSDRPVMPTLDPETPERVPVLFDDDRDGRVDRAREVIDETWVLESVRATVGPERVVLPIHRARAIWRCRIFAD